MLPDDTGRFHIQVLRIIAALYRAMPRTMHVQVPIATGTGQNDKEASSFASGTIVWLHRNLYVTGTLHPSGAIVNAQLSAIAYRILQREEQIGTLGQLVLDATKQPASEDEAAVAGLLARRLIGETVSTNTELPHSEANR